MPESLKNAQTITDETLTEVLDSFGLKLIKAEPFRKVWRIKTNAGYKYLKKSKLNPEELQFIFEVMEHLRARSFNGIARFILNKRGTPYSQCHGELFILTDWIFSREIDFGILWDLKEASRFLAEFHLTCQGFRLMLDLPSRTVWWSWPAKLKSRLLQLDEFRAIASSEKEVSAFSRLYLRYFDFYRNQAEAAYQALLRSPYPEIAAAAANARSFCHHDYSGRNLLRTFDNRLILVDFDYSLFDLRIHDLINLIVRNLKHTHWTMKISRFILEEYHRVSPLSRAEMEVMFILLTWPHDFWQVGLQYYEEKLPWPKERFLKKLEGKIKDRWERERFLKEFPEENGIYSL